MILYLLLELAVGDICPGKVGSNRSYRELLEYYRSTPSIASILDILDSMIDNGHNIPITRYIHVPFGHSYKECISSIGTGDNSHYRTILPYESISISDWLMSGGNRIPYNTALLEIRRSLLLYIIMDTTLPELDNYIHRYYHILLSSIIRSPNINGL